MENNRIAKGSEDRQSDKMDSRNQNVSGQQQNTSGQQQQNNIDQNANPQNGDEWNNYRSRELGGEQENQKSNR